MATEILEKPIIATAAKTSANNWTLDATHSAVQFSIKHLMISNARGVFNSLTSSLHFDPNNLAGSKLETEIDISSVDTHNNDRNAHLKSADFFDVAQYPTAKFVSKRFEQVAPGELNITGDLSLKGVTKEIALSVEGPTPEMKDPWGNARIGFNATTKIHRKDFALDWNAPIETGGLVLGETVTLTIEAEYVKVNPANLN